jgi:hypothetical protein
MAPKPAFLTRSIALEDLTRRIVAARSDQPMTAQAAIRP